ncbi:MAG TPA: dTDP-4-dehydrorhamnose 3,5-epimerase [Candidatus Rubrimentiphilum sp.]|nr:dTDP-4-dehydrorhamnose 3,5-epimerase [Candidatus Rubrimentiphilum sp.]
MTRIAGVLCLELAAFPDRRGLFKETYVRSKYESLGITDAFVQDNVSVSRLNVVRGLHGDPEMSKLVQVLYGKAFDVIVDARPGSQTFGQWQSFELSDENHRQLYVPRGCLHGFQALTDGVVFAYKQSAEYDPQRERAVLWNDPALGIEWPAAAAAIVSERDQRNKSFSEVFGG